MKLDDILNLLNLYGLMCNINPRRSYQDNYGPYLKNGMEFDFIVVGAGSGGSVVASRLSENPNWKVLLIEAGGYPTSNTEIPITSVLLRDPELDWKYRTEPVNTTCQASGGSCMWPMGKVLGGSSTINGMVYVRGHNEDYNSWERMGNEGWGWKDVLPYFVKSQRAVGKSGTNLGTDGPLTTTYHKSSDKMRDVLIRSAIEDGVPVHAEEAPIGLFETFNTIEDGTRCSASKAYLSKIKDKQQLYVAVHTRATKVLTVGNVATGVEVYTNGKIIKLNARKEVIVSTGSTHSPQLLMLSGIGAKNHLTQLGIKTVQNLPVGKNLQDHLMNTGIFARIDPQNKTLDTVTNALKYCAFRSGSYGNIDLLNVARFLSTTGSQYPNVQILHAFMPQALGSLNNIVEGPEQIYNMPENVRSTIENYDVLNLIPILITPQSKGKILLASKEPFAKPLIYPNYLSEESDVTTILNSINYLKRLLKTPAFAKLNAQLFDPGFPLCASYSFDTDEYWRCVLKVSGSGCYHAVGTCKMGPNPMDSVVDSRLRVHGIKNLRVIDASVMPKVISRNTNAATIMIGEKGADMIKDDWNFVPKRF